MGKFGINLSNLHRCLIFRLYLYSRQIQKFNIKSGENLDESFSQKLVSSLISQCKEKSKGSEINSGLTRQYSQTSNSSIRKARDETPTTKIRDNNKDLQECEISGSEI